MTNKPTIIEELYMKEMDEIQHPDDYFKSFTVKMNIHQFHMLRAIAERFGMPLSGFSGELLEEKIDDCFQALIQLDKENLAKTADDMTSEHLGEVCNSVAEYGLRYWEGRAWGTSEEAIKMAKKEAE